MHGELIKLMSDGEFHSGEAIARHFDVSRTAVWKAIHRLSEMGVNIDSVHGRGYRIRPVPRLLDSARILSGIHPEVRAQLAAFHLLDEVDSTSTWIKAWMSAHEPDEDVRRCCALCLAEYQSKGRGRRGRHWISPYAANLYLSVAWRFAMLPSEVSSLSLAVGVALARALQQLGVGEIGIKWPNDLYWGERKLGGILFELFGEDQGPGFVVAGIGINVDMPEPGAGEIDQPWIDLDRILPEPVDRNELAITVINETVSSMADYARDGFQVFHDSWQTFDICRGQEVKLIFPNQEITGTGAGIDEAGRFVLETAEGRRVFGSGEVSLRLDK